MVSVLGKQYFVDCNEKVARFREDYLKKSRSGKHGLHFEWINLSKQIRWMWRKRYLRFVEDNKKKGCPYNNSKTR